MLVNATYSYRALFAWQTPTSYVAQKMLFPLLQLSFFSLIGSFGGTQPLAFYLIGNAIVVAFRPMFSISMAIASERSEGTLQYLLASPSSRILIFFGRSLLHIFDGVVDILVAFGFAVVVFGLRLPDAAWPGMIVTAVVASLAACGLGFFVGAAAFVVIDAVSLGNVLMFTLLLLTGANVPVSELPAAVQVLAECVPLTHSVAAARVFAAGGDVSAGYALLATDLALGLSWAAAGFIVFRAFEQIARRRGTLEAM